jgi:hypothetical protein
MASTYYHLMKRNGRTTGKTGDPGKTYTYDRGDIVAAPKSEFKHLPGGATEAFKSEDKAEDAKEQYLAELGK